MSGYIPEIAISQNDYLGESGQDFQDHYAQVRKDMYRSRYDKDLRYKRGESRENGRMMDNCIRVDSCDFYPAENARDHHTEMYEIVYKERCRPVFRRGLPFLMSIIFKDRDFHPDEDSIRLVFNFGGEDTEREDGNIYLPLCGYDGRRRQRNEHGWQAKIDKIDGNVVDVEVFIPPNIPIGVWKCWVETSPNGFEYYHDNGIRKDKLYRRSRSQQRRNGKPRRWDTSPQMRNSSREHSQQRRGSRDRELTPHRQSRSPFRRRDSFNRIKSRKSSRYSPYRCCSTPYRRGGTPYRRTADAYRRSEENSHAYCSDHTHRHSRSESPRRGHPRNRREVSFARSESPYSRSSSPYERRNAYPGSDDEERPSFIERNRYQRRRKEELWEDRRSPEGRPLYDDSFGSYSNRRDRRREYAQNYSRDSSPSRLRSSGNSEDSTWDNMCIRYSSPRRQENGNRYRDDEDYSRDRSRRNSYSSRRNDCPYEREGNARGYSDRSRSRNSRGRFGSHPRQERSCSPSPRRYQDRRGEYSPYGSRDRTFSRHNSTSSRYRFSRRDGSFSREDDHYDDHYDRNRPDSRGYREHYSRDNSPSSLYGNRSYSRGNSNHRREDDRYSHRSSNDPEYYHPYNRSSYDRPYSRESGPYRDYRSCSRDSRRYGRSSSPYYQSDRGSRGYSRDNSYYRSRDGSPYRSTDRRYHRDNDDEERQPLDDRSYRNKSLDRCRASQRDVQSNKAVCGSVRGVPSCKSEPTLYGKSVSRDMSPHRHSYEDLRGSNGGDYSIRRNKERPRPGRYWKGNDRSDLTEKFYNKRDGKFERNGIYRNGFNDQRTKKYCRSSSPNVSDFEERFTYKQEMYILFNPWCREDPTYIEDDACRQEYVLNDVGKIWVGAKERKRGRRWVYGQFDEVVLPAVMYLLEDARLNPRGWTDPVQVVRAITQLVNTNYKEHSREDSRPSLMVGKWNGKYEDGVTPYAWTGSVKILEQYMRTGKPVKYGQCWVYAGVTTTICRALGIPCRPVTSFVSGYDNKRSRMIDKYYDYNGEEMERGPNGESWEPVGSFHCWNEVWMDRLDLPPQYGGWQAIDCSVQEEYEGNRGIGPASIAAIYRGDTELDYDTRLMYNEVNCEINHWRQDERERWNYTRIDSNQVGRQIITKRVNVEDDEGEEDWQEITGNYKTKDARKVYGNRIKRLESGRTAGNFRRVTNEFEDVEFEFEGFGSVMIGRPLHIRMTIKNRSNEIRSVETMLSCQSVYYTGVKHRNIKRDGQFFVVQPNQSKVFGLDISPQEYERHLDDFSMLKIYGFANVKETSQRWFQEVDFNFEKPRVAIQTRGTLQVGQEMELNFSFTNPLNATLSKCKFNFEAPGLQRPRTVKFRNVRPGEMINHTERFIPKEAGETKLVTTFTSQQLNDVIGCRSINIKAS